MVLNHLGEIVSNGKYIESGGNNNFKKNNVIRYDYFESPIIINNKPLNFKFDVEVTNNKNRYRVGTIKNIEVSSARYGSDLNTKIKGITTFKHKDTSFNNNISHDNDIVNNSISNNGINDTGNLSDKSINENSVNYLIPYTDHQAKNIIKKSAKFENHVAGYDTTISDFFNKYKNGADKNKTQKLYLGKANDDVLNKISNIVGYEVTDRHFIITDNDIKHIYRKHGGKDEISRGQKVIDENIINNLPSILNNPDEILKGDFVNGKYGLEFHKQMPDGKNIYIQFDNSGRGVLQGKTFYVIDNGKKIKGITPGVNGNTPHHNVLNAPEPIPINNNISHDNDIVNNSIGKNGINDTGNLSDKSSKFDNVEETSAKDLIAQYSNIDKLDKKYRKIYDNAELSEIEKEQYKALLSSKTNVDALKNISGVNVEKLQRVLDAKYRLDKARENIKKYNTTKTEGYRKLADDILENAFDFKDKKAGMLYSLDTITRNAEHVITDKKALENFKEHFIRANNKANAQKENLINEMYNIVKDIDISTKKNKEISYKVDGKIKTEKVSESMAVQFVNEAEYDIKQAEKRKGKLTSDEFKYINNTKVMLDAYKKAFSATEIDAIRKKGKLLQEKFYEPLFEQLNNTLVLNGFKPMHYRNNYFHHFDQNIFQSKSKLLNRLLKFFGFEFQKDTLPTDINGLTDEFSPRKKWAPFLMERSGNKTEFDALKGASRYLDIASEVIVRTDVIGKYREFEKALRYKFSNDGFKEELKKIQAYDLDDAAKEIEINNLYNKLKKNDK